MRLVRDEDDDCEDPGESGDTKNLGGWAGGGVPHGVTVVATKCII